MKVDKPCKVDPKKGSPTWGHISSRTECETLKNPKIKEKILSAIEAVRDDIPADAQEKGGGDVALSNKIFTLVKGGKRKAESKIRSENRILKKNKQKNPISLANKFEVLSDTGSEMDFADEDPPSSPARVKPPEPRVAAPKKLPPIVIHGTANDHKKLVADIRSRTTGEFFVKYNRQTTNIHFKQQPDWEAYQRYAKESGIDFHTYTTSSNKTHAFVLRGLNQGTSESDVIECLRDELKLPVNKVYPMRTESQRPLFLVITNKETVLKSLQRNVKYVCQTRVSWERRRNSRVLTQCHRCQRWNHATSNCHSSPRCLKCAGEHWTRECTLSREEKPTCTNCEGGHVASNLECPVYKGLLADAKRDSRRSTQKAATSTYEPAPLPATNVWHDRERRRLETLSQPATRSASQPPLRPTQPSSQRPGYSGTSAIETLDQLGAEMNRLNELIDVSKVLAALRDLNAQLSNCKDEVSRFTTFLTFINNIKVNGL